MDPMPAASRTRFAVLALAAGVILAGCVPPFDQTTPEGDGTATAAPGTPSGTPDGPAGPADLDGASLEEFYAQPVTWQDCGDGFECATVAAPLDWAAPEAGAIDLALKRWPAEGDASEHLGSLLINPGGPGGSGIEFVEWAVAGTFSPEIVAAYDVVGFDPRGVGASSPVRCGGPEVLDAFYLEDFPIESEADLDAAREGVAEFGAACLEETGPLLGHVDTVSAARDLDLMRAVLGDERLSYAGFSYGTFLGATYADLYPENVGRLLLDGALDPSISESELTTGQAVGFENALRAYVADCQAGPGCPLTGSLDDGLTQIRRVVETATATPYPAGDGRFLNGTMAMTGIVFPLYDESAWGYLSRALGEVLEDNTGTFLYELANIYFDRDFQGNYLTNSNEAFTAINCLDYPPVVRTFEEMLAFADEVRQVAPTFADDFTIGVGCESWPVPATGVRGPLTAAGAAPILVVGTTGDPATPYEWSVALAEQLESGVLMTYEGEGHTAYGRSNACVQDAVDHYLLTGEAPADGKVC